MSNEEELPQIDKFVIVLLLISAPILFLGGCSLVVLGILVLILDWSTIFVGVGLIVFGLILLAGFIFSLYLPLKRLKQHRAKLVVEDKEKEEDQNELTEIED